MADERITNKGDVRPPSVLGVQIVEAADDVFLCEFLDLFAAVNDVIFSQANVASFEIDVVRRIHRS